MKKCIRVVGVGVLFVLTAAADEWPREEIFLGYNFAKFNPNSDVIPSFNANGGSGQFQYNFLKYLGVAMDVGAVNKGVLNGFDVDTTVMNFVAGPRLTLHNRSRFVPFVEGLVGGAYATMSTRLTGVSATVPGGLPPGLVIPPDLPVTVRLRASRTGFALLAGGGLDLKLSRHVALRLFEADYYLMRTPDVFTGNITNRNNFRYAGGVNFMLGGEQPTPPPPPAAPATKKCPDGTIVPVNQACPKLTANFGLTATPNELCEGETAQVTVTNNAPSSVFAYSWSVNGQPIGQATQQPSFTFDSTGKAAGTYQIAVNATGNGFNPGSAETTINVRGYVPPTGTVQASPAEIHVGDKSALSANFTGQCGGPIQPPTFTASEGTIQGDQFDSTTVQFDPANKAEQRKSVTITAKAIDNRSSGTATTTIEVIKDAVPAEAIRLPDVLFSQNSSRVNNCGKRILLEQLRSYFERDPGGTVVLVGHSSSDEAAGIAEKRVQNAAAVITAGTGVCLAIPKTQVEVSWPGVEQNGVGFESGFCASSVGGASSVASEMRRVVVWFVPSGGKLPTSVTNNQSASTLSLSGLGCPK
jgi:outer membrane protein OmpA-like peptidoglycan-associated protein